MCIINDIGHIHEEEPSSKIIHFLEDYVFQYKWIQISRLFGCHRTYKRSRKSILNPSNGYKSDTGVFSMAILVKNGSWGIQIGPFVEI